MFGLDDLYGAAGLANMGMGLYNKYFGSKQPNPADKANEYLNKIPGMAQNAFNPYIQEGKNYGSAGDTYREMYEDPAAYFSKLTAGYQQSPGYAKAMREAMQGIANQAAAGGVAGTPMAQTAAGEKAADIANEDFQQYFNNLFGLSKEGLGGAESGMNRGFESSKSLADILSSTYGAQGQYAYAGEAGENQANSQNMSNIFSGASMTLPWLFNQKNKTPNA